MDFVLSSPNECLVCDANTNHTQSGIYVLNAFVSKTKCSKNLLHTEAGNSWLLVPCHSRAGRQPISPEGIDSNNEIAESLKAKAYHCESRGEIGLTVSNIYFDPSLKSDFGFTCLQPSGNEDDRIERSHNSIIGSVSWNLMLKLWSLWRWHKSHSGTSHCSSCMTS